MTLQQYRGPRHIRDIEWMRSCTDGDLNADRILRSVAHEGANLRRHDHRSLRHISGSDWQEACHESVIL